MSRTPSLASLLVFVIVVDTIGGQDVSRQDDARSESLKSHIGLLYSEVGAPEVPPRTTDTESVALNITLRVESARLHLSTSSQTAELYFVITFCWPHQMLSMLPSSLDGLTINPAKIWTPTMRINGIHEPANLLSQTLQVRTGRQASFQLLQRMKSVIQCENMNYFQHPFSDNNCVLKFTQEGISRRLPHLDFPNKYNSECPIISRTKNADILEYSFDYFPNEDTLANQQKTLSVILCVRHPPIGPILLSGYLPSTICLFLACAALFLAPRETQPLLQILVLFSHIVIWSKNSSQNIGYGVIALSVVDLWFTMCVVFSAFATLLSLLPWKREINSSVTRAASTTSSNVPYSAHLFRNSCNGSKIGMRVPHSFFTEHLSSCDAIPPSNSEASDTLESGRGVNESAMWCGRFSALTRVGWFSRLTLSFCLLLQMIIYWSVLLGTMYRCPIVNTQTHECLESGQRSSSRNAAQIEKGRIQW